MSVSAYFLALERLAHTWLRERADRRLHRRAVAAGERPKPRHLLTGERGEDAAFFLLRERGFTIVARRWKSNRRPGDLDLVAWDGATLVIFEVKTRTARDLYPADIAVDRGKQRVLRKMAAAYLRQIPERHRSNVSLRFDVVSVYLLGGAAEMEHVPGAFPAREPVRREQW